MLQYEGRKASFEKLRKLIFLIKNLEGIAKTIIFAAENLKSERLQVYTTQSRYKNSKLQDGGFTAAERSKTFENKLGKKQNKG